MGLTRFAINRPVTITMFILALVLMGSIAYTRLPVSRYPNLDIPRVSIRVSYPGASPQDVEQLVAEPIEEAMNGLSGVTDITSTSREGSAAVSLRLTENADVNELVGDVNRRLSAIRSRLPADIDSPSVRKIDPEARPIMNISLSGDASLGQLYDLATDTVAPRLQSLDGVGQVDVVGGLESEVQVLVDPTKVQSYGLSLQQVRSALAENHLSSPGGTVYQGPTQLGLRTSAKLTDLEQFDSIVVSSGPSGNVYLKDVARVEDGYAPQRTLQRFNGKFSVGLSIILQSGANTVHTVELVREELSRLRRSLPRGVSFNVTNDKSRFTRASIEAVQTDLMIAVLFCGLVLMVFLHAWRNTVIVLLAIPTSLISTFLVMYLLGFSLNTISLMGLALIVGILVDDSIVVLENIHRHRQLGEEPLLAALNGRSEIGVAAIAITLTDVVVFLPVAFVPGVLGQLLREFGLTIVVATLFSLFISFTLAPMLAAHWLKAERVDQLNKSARRGLLAPLRGFGPWWDAGMERLQGFYRVVLGWSLRHRPVVLLIAAAALGGALAFIPLHLLGTEYVPFEDDGQFDLRVEMDPGTSLEATSEAVSQIESRLLELPEVVGVFSSVGYRGRADTGALTVQLVGKRERQRSSLEVLEEARDIGRTIAGATVSGNVSQSIGRGRNPIRVRIIGDDLDVLDDLAGQVLTIVRNTPGTIDARVDEVSGLPELQAVADRSRMAPLGITPADMASNLRMAVNGTVVGRFERPGGATSDVRLKLDGAEKMTAAQLGALPIFAPATGDMVRLDQIADLQHTTGPSEIRRASQQRRMTVVGDISGRALGDVGRDLRAQFKELPLPPGYRISFRGQVNRLSRAFNALLFSLALSSIFVYMLLAALYEDLLRPLAIMFSIPLALIGAFVGLWISGNTINLFSMLGMILLMALVAKNGILLVDYTDTLRKRGLARSEAIIEASVTRLRPILMTSFTIVFAMIPLSLKLAPGAEARSPVAVVLMGGVLSSMLLTLVVVPVVYTQLEDVVDALSSRLFRRGKAPTAPVGASASVFTIATGPSDDE